MLIGAALSVVVLLARAGALAARHAPCCRSRRPVGLVVVVAPWFADDARRGPRLLLRALRAARVLGRDGGRPLAVSRSRHRGCFGRVLESTPLRWVGGDLVRDVPLALADLPRAHRRRARTSMGSPCSRVRLDVVVALSWVTHVLVAEPIRRGVRLRSPRLARSAVVMVVIAVGAGRSRRRSGAEPALSGDVGQLVDRGGPPTVPAAARGYRRRRRALPWRPRRRHPSSCSSSATRRRRRWRKGSTPTAGTTACRCSRACVVWNRAILGCPIISRPTVISSGEPLHNKCGGEGFWQRQWPEDVAAFQSRRGPRVAGAWDVFDVENRRAASIGPGDPAWTAGYESDVGQLFDMLHSTGAPVVAIEPPCFGRNERTGRRSRHAASGSTLRVPPRCTGCGWSRRRATARPAPTSTTLLCPNGVVGLRRSVLTARISTPPAPTDTAPVVVDVGPRRRSPRSGRRSVLGAHAS